MSTDTTPAPQTGVAETGQQGPRIAVSALVTNLRDYGLVLALIAIMIFFQFTTDGTLFKPVNLSNLVQQNSFIIVMALGMLLVIVSGHIDLSVGSVAGFIGALAAMMMVIWPLGFLSNPLVVSIVCGRRVRSIAPMPPRPRRPTCDTSARGAFTPRIGSRCCRANAKTSR